MMHSRAASPTADLNTQSEDGSDFSSGMVVCDLSNEFRRYSFIVFCTHSSPILMCTKFKLTAVIFTFRQRPALLPFQFQRRDHQQLHCEESNSSTAVSRLRVRRKHHGMNNGSATPQRTGARSKPRIPLTAISHHHRVRYSLLISCYLS